MRVSDSLRAPPVEALARLARGRNGPVLQLTQLTVET